MRIPWTNFRFTRPDFITERRYIAAQSRVKAHRMLVFDELRIMSLRLGRMAAWLFVFGMSALVVTFIIESSESRSNQIIDVIYGICCLFAIACAVSLVLTIGSFIGFAVKYWYYWERVIAVAAISTSYDEFLEEAITRNLLEV